MIQKTTFYGVHATFHGHEKQKASVIQKSFLRTPKNKSTETTDTTTFSFWFVSEKNQRALADGINNSEFDLDDAWWLFDNTNKIQEQKRIAV